MDAYDAAVGRLDAPRRWRPPALDEFDGLVLARRFLRGHIQRATRRELGRPERGCFRWLDRIDRQLTKAIAARRPHKYPPMM